MLFMYTYTCVLSSSSSSTFTLHTSKPHAGRKTQYSLTLVVREHKNAASVRTAAPVQYITIISITLYGRGYYNTYRYINMYTYIYSGAYKQLAPRARYNKLSHVFSVIFSPQAFQSKLRHTCIISYRAQYIMARTLVCGVRGIPSREVKKKKIKNKNAPRKRLVYAPKWCVQNVTGGCVLQQCYIYCVRRIENIYTIYVMRKAACAEMKVFRLVCKLFGVFAVTVFATISV